MKVDDYINKMNKTNNHPKSYYGYRDLDSYKNITVSKNELIKSVQPYLIDEEYIDILHLYNDFKYPIFDTGYVQTLDDDMVRYLEPIRLSWEGRNDYSPSIVISEDEFINQYDQIFKYGSQEYAFISLRAYKYDEELGYHKIFYTKDNHVFIDSNAATAIAYWSEDDIGERLASICKYHADYARRKNEEYTRRMTKNYRMVR